MRGPFPIERQDALSRELIERFGATWDSFRLDTTVHPFARTSGSGHPADDAVLRGRAEARSS